MPRISENVIPRPGGGVLIRRPVEIEVPAGTSMLKAETLMQEALQEAGAGMVEEFLHAPDPPLDALERQGRKWTRKLTSEPRVVESTFGAVTISRWAYQTSSGGRCCYPLDEKMDLAGSATPKFAKSLVFKMAHAPAATGCGDLAENHGRTVSDMVEAGKGHGARRKAWLGKACSRLKHEDGAAAALLREMEKRRRDPALGEAARERLDKSITYLRHNLSRMDYAERLRGNHPIAGGVTEAACGLIIKDRMCNRGRRWSLRTAQHLITLRSLIKSTGGGWQNFWKSSFSNPVN